jgi:hypothetical protein
VSVAAQALEVPVLENKQRRGTVLVEGTFSGGVAVERVDVLKPTDQGVEGQHCEFLGKGWVGEPTHPYK